jgi:ribonuclease HI
MIVKMVDSMQRSIMTNLEDRLERLERAVMTLTGYLTQIPDGLVQRDYNTIDEIIKKEKPHKMVAKLWTDGGSRGNPGPSACGFVLTHEDGTVIDSGSKRLGDMTNNAAEYYGLLSGLASATAFGVTDLTVFSDSELMVKQITGEYKVKHPQLQELYLRTMQMIKPFKSIDYIAVLRGFNKAADTLVNEALDS